MANTEKTVDHTLHEIISAMQSAIGSGKIKGQIARDIDKLCAAAAASRFYEDEEKARG